jgi:4-diphosphocytidyl-2-C-methyl-D-erythritol kinase
VKAEIILPSFAKINLGLRVLSRRPDGYHNICTIFQTVSLYDTIKFSPSDTLELTCSDSSIPTGNDNLIIQAANTLRERYGVSKGASIHLEKRIPSPSGLGGGSSNAAVALLGLNKLWDLGAEHSDLVEFGAALGSDIPFFFVGGTAIGTGRGTDLEPVRDLELSDMILVTPNIAVSTAIAFDQITPENLTTIGSERILLNCRLGVESGHGSSLDLENDFEKLIFDAHPEIRRAKEKLIELGAAKAAMSGSGSSIFGSFDNKETRQTAMKALGSEANWRSFAVAAISRDMYREALKQVQ